MTLACQPGLAQTYESAYQQNYAFAEQARILEAQRAASAADRARSLEQRAWNSPSALTSGSSFLATRSTSRASTSQAQVTFAPVYDPATDPMNVAARILRAPGTTAVPGRQDASSAGAASQQTMQRDAEILATYFGQSGSRNAAAAVAAARPLAEQGNAAAALVLAVANLNGDGIARNDAQAFAWMSRAAEAGLQPAQVLLGEMYLVGIGVPADRGAAVEQFERAANSGYASGHLRMAQTLLDNADRSQTDFATALVHAEAARSELPRAGFEAGLILFRDRPGVPRDLPRAATAFRSAATAGHPEAQYLYAICLEAGLGIARDPATALRWLEKAAEQGVPVAQAQVGEAYAYGLMGAAPDRNRALPLLEAAAHGGEATAYNTLGVLLSASASSDADLRRAIEYFRKGAELGDPPAEFNIGVAYLDGVGVVRDQRHGVTWITRSADAGHAPAQYYMGLMHQVGEVVPRDDEAAVQRFEQGAAQGYAPAMNDLCTLAFLNKGGRSLEVAMEPAWLSAGLSGKQPACLYVAAIRALRGIGSTPDPDLGISLLRESAELGYHYAESDLGQLYLLGRYVPLDPALGRDWLIRAANDGNKRARELLQQADLQ